MGVQQNPTTGEWEALDDATGGVVGIADTREKAEESANKWNTAPILPPDNNFGVTTGDPVNRSATQTPLNSEQAEVNAYNRRLDLQRYIAGGGADPATINQLQQNISQADSVFSRYLTTPDASNTLLNNQSSNLYQKVVDNAGKPGFSDALDQLFQNERNLQGSNTSSGTTPSGNNGAFDVGNLVTPYLDSLDQRLQNFGDNIADNFGFGNSTNTNPGNTQTVTFPTNNTWNSTPTTTTVAQNTYTGPTDHRVRLRPKKLDLLNNDVLKPLYHTNGLLFPYTPQIAYNQNVNYSAMDITHGNQDYQLYKNTGSVEITINGQFTAQNRAEAIYMMSAIHFLRSMSKMYFGENDQQRGLPPPVLMLSGYGNMMFNQVPVIMRNFSINFDQNVDYVRLEFRNGDVNSFAWVPTLTSISVSLIVQKTPADWRDEFTWDKFANGSLIDKGWV